MWVIIHMLSGVVCEVWPFMNEEDALAFQTSKMAELGFIPTDDKSDWKDKLSYYFDLNSLNSPKVKKEAAEKLIEDYTVEADVVGDGEMHIHINNAKWGTPIETFLEELQGILEENEYFVLHLKGEDEVYGHSLLIITENETFDLSLKLTLTPEAKRAANASPLVSDILNNKFPELL